MQFPLIAPAAHPSVQFSQCLENAGPHPGFGLRRANPVETATLFQREVDVTLNSSIGLFSS